MMMIRNILVFCFAITALLCPHSSQAQTGPANLNVSGMLFLPSGTPVTQNSVNFRLEVWDKTSTCILYSEDHLAQDLSGSKGGFSLAIGKGTSPTNFLESSSSFTTKLFENSGAVAGGWPNCPSGTTLNSGDERVVRISYDLGAGLVAMSPDVPIASSAFAMVADTLQGKRPTDFVQLKDDATYDLNQANVENVFSAANYARLQQLLNPTASLGFGSQRLTSVADPTSAQDAATKNYTDSRLAGQTIDLQDVAPGFGGGKVLTWDQAQNKWVAQAPTIAGTAGGDLTGSYPNPTVAAGAIGTSKLADNAVTSAKINSSGVATNRLLITDATTGATVTYATCANDEVLKYVTGAGWQCATVSSLSAVTSVAGKTGAVTLNALDISGLGTAAIHNVGVGATEIPQLNGSGKLANSVIPAFLGDVTGAIDANIVVALQGRPVASTIPNPNEVLRWNGSQWEPQALTDNGITALTGDISASGNGSVAATLTNGVVTTPKMFANPGVNRLVATDNSSGGTLVPFVCNLNETMQWTAGGWACTTVNSLLGTQFIVDGGNARGANIRIGTSDAYALNLITSGASRLYIGTTGWVGVGTTAPAQAFDLNGSMTTNGSIYMTSGGNTGRIWYDGVLKLDNGSNTTRVMGPLLVDGNAYITSGNIYTGASSLNLFGSQANGTDNPIRFYSNNGSNERMRIDSNGRVGIGTTSPHSAFEVNGDINLTSGTVIGYRPDTQSFTVGSDTLAHYGIGIKTGNFSGFGTHLSGYNGIAAYTFGAERLRITTAGNVGIGTTGPNRLLEVAGPIRIQPATLPASPAAGDLAFDSTGNSLKFHNGTNWQTVGTSSATGDFMANGTVPMTGNLRLNGNYLSGDGGNEGVFVDSSGLVGIGTSSPTAFLDVSGNNSTTTARFFDQTAGTGKTQVIVRAAAGQVGTGTTASPFQIQDNTGTTAAYYDIGNAMFSAPSFWLGTGANGIWQSNQVSYRSDTRLTWSSSTNASAAKDTGLTRPAAATLAVGNGTADDFSGTIAAGKLGIGITTPSAIMHVKGSAPQLYVQDSASTNAQIARVGMLKYYDSANTPFGYLGDGSSTFNSMDIGTLVSEPVRIVTNNSEAVRVSASGNVGIGTTTPNRLLDVAGAIHLAPVTNPASPGAGDIYIDSGAGNSLKYHNGSNWVSIGTGSGDFMKDGSVAMTGQFRSIAGTAANPGFTFTGDTDNGIFAPAADNLAIATSGSEKLRVLANGNVGIGVTNPSVKLHVYGGTENIITGGGDQTSLYIAGGSPNRITFGNTGPAIIGIETVSNFIQMGTAGDLGLWAGGTNQNISLTPSGSGYTLLGGNVGIGTSAPTQKLDVTSGIFRVKNSDFVASSTGTFLDMSLGASSGNTYAQLQGYTNGGINPANILLNPVSGNVGIGTTSPFSPLSIYKAITGSAPASSGSTDANVLQRIQSNTVALDIGMTNPGDTWLQARGNIGDLSVNNKLLLNPNGGNVGIGTTSPTSNLQVSGATGTNIAKFSTGSTSGLIYVDDTIGRVDLGSGNTNATTAAKILTFSTNAIGSGSTTERMRIDALGNVGIGTASPSARLHSMPTGAGTLGVLIGNSTYSTSAFNGMGMQVNDSGVGIIRAGWGTAKDLLLNDAGGNVGIGTTSPSRSLQVAGAIRLSPTASPASPAAGDIYIDSGASNLLKYHNGSNWVPLTSGGSGDFMANGSVSMTGNIRLNNNWLSGDGGNEGVFVTSAGNVGVGTTSPNYPLQVQGGGSTIGTEYILSRFDYSGAGNAGVAFGYYYGASAVDYAQVRATGGVPLALSTSGGNGQVVLTTAGNLGVGTSAPSARLHSLPTGAGTLGLLIGNSTYSSSAFNAMGMQINDSGVGIIRAGWATAKDLLINDTGGNVGIGTSLALSRLHLLGTSGAYNQGLALQGNGSSNPSYIWNNSSGNMNFAGNGQSSPVMTVTNSYVGIGTTAPATNLDVVGDIQFTGSLIDASDRRLKENIREISGGLDVVRKIQTYSFTMKDDPKKQVEFGVMAQEMKEILPDIVHIINPKMGYMGVNYVSLIPWSIRAIQEIDRDVAALKERVNTLEEQNRELERKNKNIEEKLDAILKRLDEK